jgi:NAD-dependent deacetylase
MDADYAHAGALLRDALAGPGPLVVLTGAGISAESGVPTFRGPEGYWRVGSRNYHPMELATRAAFEAMPAEVWRWYLHRRSVCRAAAPNAAHRALAAAEAALGGRFLLVTQNVDGLHRRAGSTPGRCYEIHGNIDHCRCSREQACPAGAGPRPLGAGPGPDDAPELRCPCGAWLRPHVLWFDESYDEARYRYQSTCAAIERAAALLVVGTSGATSLPALMCERAAARRIAFVVVDPERTAFAELAMSTPDGLFLPGAATAVVPALLAMAMASAPGTPPPAAA